VNFIVLGKLVEKISGLPLDQFAGREIFEPLQMPETSFNPELQLRSRAAPTTKREDGWIRGQVHDPRSFAMGGVAGHAGLFSTASDLALYAQTMLDGGILDAIPDRQPVRILSVDAVNLMTRNYQVSGGIRGLGWDKQTGFSSNKGTRLSNSAFGHGGFTGTVLWIDPELDLFFIFLSNRVHPNGSGNVNTLAGQILDVVVDAIQTE
jgi:CubicO group peptidase (beta-lactamase class C family)